MIGNLLRIAAAAGGAMFDFTQGATLPSGWEFSRASTSGIGQVGCTFIQADGTFALAAADVLRPARATGGGSLRGVLIEPQGKNLILRSSLTGNTSISTPPTGWLFLVGTGTSASVASDYGSGDGASAVQQSATSGQRPALYQAVSMTQGVTYVMSFYLEAVVSGTPTYNGLLVPNASSGSIGTVEYFREGVAVSPTDPAVPGRIWARFTCTPTTGTGTVQMRLGLGAAASVVGEVRFSRPQMDDAASWPSSYIPTASAAITRPADGLYAPVAVLPCTAALGTVVVGYERLEAPGKQARALGLLAAADDLVGVAVHSGGSADHDATDGTDTLETSDGVAGVNRAAYSWNAGEGLESASFSVNGGGVVSGNLAAPTGLVKVRMGGARSTQVLGGAISYFAAYSDAKTGADLEALAA